MQRREALDLLADLRRTIQQKPLGGVGADGHAFLGAGDNVRVSSPHAAAVWAPTVPLRETAARGRAQDPDQHRRLPETRQPFPRPDGREKGCESERLWP